MPGPAPKDPSTRARRNKTTTAATLDADGGDTVERPDLPDLGWHPLAVQWWEDLWSSPMSPEYLNMDRHVIMRYGQTVSDYWLAESPKERAEIHVRLEAMSKALGTDPMARRSLQWSIEQVETAQEKRKRRGSGREKTEQPKGDPRATLRAV